MPIDREDGGPAFAATAVSASDDVYHQCGLSMRDYFAAAALAGLAARVPVERVAEFAYRIADAMIAARKSESSQ